MPLRTLVLSSSVLVVACVAFAATAGAQNMLISLNKPYAYFKAVPGQPPNHYRDDGPITGPHTVYTTGLGKYGRGLLTDGSVASVTQAGAGRPLLGMFAPCTCAPTTKCCAKAPAADIVFDLGNIHIVSDFVIGTIVLASSNNNAPDDVSISFSVNGISFSAARRYDLEKMYGPLADGHHDLKLKIGGLTPARYVKFSFDGGSMAEPNGADPNEKWMLDEISIFGVANTCKASSSSYGKGLAGKNGIPTLRLSAAPKFKTKINVLASNSSGTATSALLIVGLRESTISVLGGTLLVQPLAEFAFGLSASGLVLPVTVPGSRCGLPVCIQLLQLDKAAVSGVSMTAGLRLDLGT